MDKLTEKALVADGQKLAALLAPALEAQQKVASLEKTAAQLTAENERLRGNAQTRRETMKTAADEAADFFERCGALKSEKRAEFVDALTDQPQMVFELVRDYSDKIASGKAGAGMDQIALPATGKNDAIDRMLHGD